MLNKTKSDKSETVPSKMSEGSRQAPKAQKWRKRPIFAHCTHIRKESNRIVIYHVKIESLPTPFLFLLYLL